MKHSKHTDQEWFDLILESRTSELRVKDWCKQHNITGKALYYHTRRLREQGYDIPARTSAGSYPKQEIVCFETAEGHRPSCSTLQGLHGFPDNFPAAARIDFHGIRIELSSYAGADSMANLFRTLLELCQATFPECQKSI